MIREYLPVLLQIIVAIGFAVSALVVSMLLGKTGKRTPAKDRSEEHTSELQSQSNLVCRLLLEKKKKIHHRHADHRVADDHPQLRALAIGVEPHDAGVCALSVIADQVQQHLLAIRTVCEHASRL